MISGLAYILHGEKLIKCFEKYSFWGNLQQVSDHIASGYLSTMCPLFFIQDDVNKQILKIELIEGQVVKSYVLDLFDFDKELSELDK